MSRKGKRILYKEKLDGIEFKIKPTIYIYFYPLRKWVLTTVWKIDPELKT